MLLLAGDKLGNLAGSLHLKQKTTNNLRKMKALLQTLKVLPLLAIVLSLTAAAPAGNCYDRYAKKFEERGAREVEDGWHEGVVITFRKGSNADCSVGMVKVEKGKITQLKLRFADGTYELYTQKFKDAGEFVITNGISTTKITLDDELVNVVFVKHIKAPKKKYTAAPDPDDL